MPINQSDAISQALANAEGPALVLDVEFALLLAANRAAAEMWTGGRQIAALPLALDAAMPALAALRAVVVTDGEGAPQRSRLTFWTPAGGLCWDAQIQPIGDAAGRIVLITPGSVQLPAIRPIAGSALPGRELRHLAHELRTPLAAIQSLADVLHGGHLGAVANARHRDYLASMRETARHALDVIEAMLEAPFGPPSTVSPAAGLDLNAVVAEVVAGLSALAARSGARLSMTAAPELPLIAAEAREVRQMLINLAANSLVHAGAGVTVAFATGTAELNARSAREVWVEVADTGPGIPASVLVRLAEGAPLGAADGSGRPQLGLSLTRSLAAANNGRLELASGPEGSRARLVFATYQPPGADQVVASSSG